MVITDSDELYLVCFVVILWVVLEDLWLLLVLEIPYKVVNSKFFPPFLTLDEPEALVQSTDYCYLGESHICFARSTLNFRARRNRSYSKKFSSNDFPSPERG